MGPFENFVGPQEAGGLDAPGWQCDAAPSYISYHLFPNLFYSLSILLVACQKVLKGLHKVQKPSKESGILQSLGKICCFFLEDRVRRGVGRAAMALLNTQLDRFPIHDLF